MTESEPTPTFASNLARLDTGIIETGIDPDRAPLYSPSHNILLSAGVSVEDIESMPPEQRRTTAYQIVNRQVTGRPMSRVDRLTELRESPEQSYRKEPITDAAGVPELDEEGEYRYRWVGPSSVKDAMRALGLETSNRNLEDSRRTYLARPTHRADLRRHRWYESHLGRSLALRTRLGMLEDNYGNGIGADRSNDELEADFEPRLSPVSQSRQSRRAYRKARREGGRLRREITRLEGPGTVTHEGTRWTENSGSIGDYEAQAETLEQRRAREGGISREALAEMSEDTRLTEDDV